jgi:hypothetical protein
VHPRSFPFDLIGHTGRSTEDILSIVADQRGIDRSDENSFSTYQFPKPIYAADVSGAEVCTFCGRSLALHREPPA